VVLGAVELEGEVVLREVDVDLRAVDLRVEEVGREVVAACEGGELVLEVAAGAAGAELEQGS
jgi:hypothetical protein